MEFDITHLDKRIVLQALFAFAAPLGIGKAEFKERRKRGENVIGLTDTECEILLTEFSEMKSGIKRILDYHKGKPMKVVFEKKSNGRVLVDSDSYDSRNGKYKFFEALLETFLLEDILITKKGYKQFALDDLRPELIRPKEEELVFKSIIKKLKPSQSELGKYWIIDTRQTMFVPQILRK
jgi:hypothetical protein